MSELEDVSIKMAQNENQGGKKLLKIKLEQNIQVQNV